MPFILARTPPNSGSPRPVAPMNVFVARVLGLRLREFCRGAVLTHRTVNTQRRVLVALTAPVAFDAVL